MFLTTIQSQGLPWPDGTVRSPEKVFDFLFCLAEENQNKWLMGIASVREDRSDYAPVSESQGEWVDAQGELMRASGCELSWYFRNAHAAFEFVERLGTCRIGPSLQERYVAAGHDVIAPPLNIAEQMLATALAALAQNRDAQAFDVATRLLCGEGFRPRARQIRERGGVIAIDVGQRTHRTFKPRIPATRPQATVLTLPAFGRFPAIAWNSSFPASLRSG